MQDPRLSVNRRCHASASVGNSGQATPRIPDCNPSPECECACAPAPAGRRDDGISDGAEDELGTDPEDADTDDDGVIDGEELGPDMDQDGDGVINALDADSDNDGLPDGTELGLACNHADTDRSRGKCVPDADGGATKTNPLDRDTDAGAARDGADDWNHNGASNPESNPTLGQGADDINVIDMDADGLGDDLEEELDSDPLDADSDEDGVGDGDEADPAFDGDGDLVISLLDVDSDNDGLLDGTELGKGCGDPATDASQGHCRADADGGATKTSPVNPDTDGGGMRALGGHHLNGVSTAARPIRDAKGDDACHRHGWRRPLDTLEKAIGTNPNDADSAKTA